MSQERTDDLAVYLGLQGFTMESVESLRQGSGVVKVAYCAVENVTGGWIVEPFEM